MDRAALGIRQPAVLVIALLLLGLVPTSVHAELETQAPGQVDTVGIDVADQPVVDQQTTIERVLTAQDGWIVMYADEGGGPGPQLGRTAVSKGESRNVFVKLGRDVPANAALWARLHIDAGARGTYEFPGPDSPVFHNNKIVQARFTVVPAKLPDTGGPEEHYTTLLGITLICLLLGLRLRQGCPGTAR